jgi:hypothetical protein
MFDTGCGSEAIADDAAAQVDAELEDAFAWASIERELRQGGEDRTFGNTSPSGFFALEIDTDTRCEDGLTDAQLIDAMVGFERLTGWAQARQARLLAEFARRRPGDDPTMVATDKPCTMSRFAPDEVGLALTLARGPPRPASPARPSWSRCCRKPCECGSRAGSTNAASARSATPPTT